MTNHFVLGIANNHNRPKIKIDYEQKFRLQKNMPIIF